MSGSLKIGGHRVNAPWTPATVIQPAQTGPTNNTPWTSATFTQPTQTGPKHCVVYAPFPAITGVRRLGTSWEAHKKYTVLRHGDSEKPLAGVKRDTVVYVVCHTSPMGDTCSDNAGNKLTAVQLAQRLKEDGLTPLLKVMKLYACNGAVGGSNSFASKLLGQLRNLNYNWLSLYGYTSEVTSLDPKTGAKTGYDYLQGFVLDAHGEPKMTTIKMEVRASTKRVLVPG